MRPPMIRQRKRPAKKREVFRGIDFNEIDLKKPKTFLEKVQAKKANIEAMLEQGKKVYLCQACIEEYYLRQLARAQLSLDGKLIKRPCNFCGKKKPCEIRGA